MARGLMKALHVAGFEPSVASTLQVRDSAGCAQRQSELIKAAHHEAQKIIDAAPGASWRAWITYHNYYKAPDLVGPQVSRALNIPYVLIEATRARKRLTGAWARFSRLAEEASDTANAICYMTERDAEALRAYAPAGQVIRRLRPFLARENLPPQTTRSGSLLSVGMMRKGDKLASYELIAQALALLKTKDWHLQIAGDGPARPDVEALMSLYGEKVTFLGALDPIGLQQAFCNNSILFWPGVNEAFGMTYLEAQAAGLAVLAQARPGVTDVLTPGHDYPAVEDGAPALASKLDVLLSDKNHVAALGQDARRHVGEHHLVSGAAITLETTLGRVL